VADDDHRPIALSRKGDREIGGFVAGLAARLEPASVAARRRRAESERCVTIRPAPDTMVYLIALLPVAQGVGAYAALRASAVTAVGTGEASSIGQAMADEFVRRATGQAAVGRALVADNLDAGAKVWLKRLSTWPGSSELINLDSRARLFPPALAEFIGLRDQWCRNLWCGAKIRHRDHIEDHADGGPTSAANGQGLCEDCNQTTSAPGWHSARDPSSQQHIVVVTTPTGHRYRSRTPA
jgi:hypothetical protein